MIPITQQMANYSAGGATVIMRIPPAPPSWAVAKRGSGSGRQSRRGQMLDTRIPLGRTPMGRECSIPPYFWGSIWEFLQRKQGSRQGLLVICHSPASVLKSYLFGRPAGWCIFFYLPGIREKKKTHHLQERGARKGAPKCSLFPLPKIRYFFIISTTTRQEDFRSPPRQRRGRFAQQ